MHMQAVILFLLGVASASPTHLLEERQTSCPKIHVFGARETTVSQGYGTAGAIVKLILGAYPGATSEAIVYPACGGQASCGGISYASSVLEGTKAVTSAINAFNTRCPNTQLVLVGYSQGAQVMDNAFCGGDTGSGLSETSIPIQASAIAQIKVAIWMGDPRFRSGFSFNVGTCTTHGFSPRPVGFVCPFAAKVQSYCDAADPYCCTGSDQATHQGYGAKYGPVSLTFVKSKLSTSGSGNTNAAIPAPNFMGPVSRTVHRYGQCGGIGWTGSSVCAAGLTCTAANAYYSLCL